MITKTIQAWVLHKRWSGETSARVTFFTRESGLIHCTYKGGRTLKKQSLLQAFTPLWVSVDERHDQYYVRSIESSSSVLPLEGNALFSGLYLNELLYYVLNPAYPDVELFDAYHMAIEHLAITNDRLVIEALLRRFEWTLLKSCGYSFSLTHEAVTSDGIRPDQYYRFVAGEGFISHSTGLLGEHILALAQDNLENASYLKSAKLIMRQAIDHLLGGREIKSRSLYQA